MDFFKWLANQPKMTDPHANARALMAGTRMFNNATNNTPAPGGYDSNVADLVGNNTPLIDPAKLTQDTPTPNQSLLSTDTTPSNTSNNTNTYGEADLALDTNNSLIAPLNESKYTPTDTNIGPSLLMTTRQEDKSPDRVMNDIANQAVLDNGQRIGQEPILSKTDNPSLLAIQPLLDRYGGNRDMALIAKKMSPELMDALLSQYGVQWKDNLADHLKQFLIDNNAY